MVRYGRGKMETNRANLKIKSFKSEGVKRQGKVAELRLSVAISAALNRV
jgi:hypothetical protein